MSAERRELWARHSPAQLRTDSEERGRSNGRAMAEVRRALVRKRLVRHPKIERSTAKTCPQLNKCGKSLHAGEQCPSTRGRGRLGPIEGLTSLTMPWMSPSHRRVQPESVCKPEPMCNAHLQNKGRGGTRWDAERQQAPSTSQRHRTDEPKTLGDLGATMARDKLQGD